MSTQVSMQPSYSTEIIHAFLDETGLTVVFLCANSIKFEILIPAEHFNQSSSYLTAKGSAEPGYQNPAAAVCIGAS